MAKTVAGIINAKGSDVYTIQADSTVYEALQLMAEKNVGALVVMRAGHVVGIFSERDYARKIILQGKTSREVPVREIMSRKVISVNPHRTAEECMAIMISKRIRHLPVMDETNKLAGIISIGDAVKAVLDEREFVIEQLEEYITGRR